MNFPKELNLSSNKPMAPMAKPSINRYRSDNSTYSAGDTIRIEIPTGRQGQYLFTSDSFLEGRVSLNYTTTAIVAATVNACGFIDQSVYALFNRMRIIHGSTVVEDVLFPNRLWTVLYDMQVNEVERRQDTITKMVYDNTVSTAYQTTGGLKYNNHLAGALMIDDGTVTANTSTRFFYFSFCLPSSVVGLLCSKALPLGLMNSSSLYIELELAPVNVAFVGLAGLGTTGGTLACNNYTVQDIYYNGKITTLPSDVNSALIESTGGVINIPGVAYKCESKSISINQTQFTDKFSFQFSSIKTFLFWFTNTATAAGGINVRSISSRPKCKFNEYYLSLNG